MTLFKRDNENYLTANWTTGKETKFINYFRIGWKVLKMHLHYFVS